MKLQPRANSRTFLLIGADVHLPSPAPQLWQEDAAACHDAPFGTGRRIAAQVGAAYAVVVRIAGGQTGDDDAVLAYVQRIVDRVGVAARLRAVQHRAVGEFVGRPGHLEGAAGGCASHVRDDRRCRVADELQREGQRYLAAGIGKGKDDAVAHLAEERLQVSGCRDQRLVGDRIGVVGGDARCHVGQQTLQGTGRIDQIEVTHRIGKGHRDARADASGRTKQAGVDRRGCLADRIGAIDDDLVLGTVGQGNCAEEQQNKKRQQGGARTVHHGTR